MRRWEKSILKSIYFYLLLVQNIFNPWKRATHWESFLLQNGDRHDLVEWNYFGKKSWCPLTKCLPSRRLTQWLMERWRTEKRRERMTRVERGVNLASSTRTTPLYSDVRDELPGPTNLKDRPVGLQRPKYCGTCKQDPESTMQKTGWTNYFSFLVWSGL